VAIGSDPSVDAAELAKMVVDGDDDSVGVRELHASTGWSIRRFNPALSIVLQEIDSGRVSREMNPDYPSLSFFMMAEDRVALRRMIARVGGG